MKPVTRFEYHGVSNSNEAVVNQMVTTNFLTQVHNSDPKVSLSPIHSPQCHQLLQYL